MNPIETAQWQHIIGIPVAVIMIYYIMQVIPVLLMLNAMVQVVKTINEAFKS